MSFPEQASETTIPARLAAALAGRLKEVGGILLFATALWLSLALLTYHPDDPGWSFAISAPDSLHNGAGTLGARLADVILYVLGAPGYFLPIFFLTSALRLLYARRVEAASLSFFLHTAGCVLLLVGATVLAWMHLGEGYHLPRGVNGAGGILGDLMGGWLWAWAGETGTTLFALALFLVGFSLYADWSWLRLMDVLGRFALYGLACMHRRFRALHLLLQDRVEGSRSRRQREDMLRRQQQVDACREPPKIQSPSEAVVEGERAEGEKQQVLFQPPACSRLPTLHLLDEVEEGRPCYSAETLESLSRLLELKLQDFGVAAKVVEVHPGPVITRFELALGTGVKVSKISNLAKDLARSLSVISVRIVEIIPGKSVIGLEIPNAERDQVSLREILGSREYEDMNSPLAIGLGKDISGRTAVADLAKMPHLLVAGTTGSGKSVALNAMILSLLYKSPAELVRLIMIDPKMLELSVYQGIPHLLSPVVTDMKEAANALHWSIAEMERRYRLMSSLGVRNITACNRKIKDAAARGAPLANPVAAANTSGDSETAAPVLEALPYIVIIVDELADMMMTTGKKVEVLIARLAQKARAAGIHLVLATQRPSVDVITGLIKANIPSRIAFQVSSKVDSRTILDQSGAESLLGHGDMLYLPSGTSVPVRVHGAFVSDDEVHKVVGSIAIEGEPQYVDVLRAAEGVEAGTAEESDVTGDPLYDEAVGIVRETRKASISYLQRRLKVGYNRAARLVEEMEKHGVLGPSNGNGSREVKLPPLSGETSV